MALQTALAFTLVAAKILGVTKKEENMFLLFAGILVAVISALAIAERDHKPNRNDMLAWYTWWAGVFLVPIIIMLVNVEVDTEIETGVVSSMEIDSSDALLKLGGETLVYASPDDGVVVGDIVEYENWDYSGLAYFFDFPSKDDQFVKVVD